MTADDDFMALAASAGSGKTTILVERYCRTLRRLMQRDGLSPARAVDAQVAVSFTEKSVQEIRDRLVRTLTPEYGSTVAFRAARNVQTIHGFAKNIFQYPWIFPGLAVFGLRYMGWLRQKPHHLQNKAKER